MWRTIEIGATTYRALDAMNTNERTPDSCSENRFATAPTAATTRMTFDTASRPRRAWEVCRDSRTVAIWTNSTIDPLHRADSDTARMYVAMIISRTSP
jgi:hypothetical protein